jgi:plasmid replication initiation protein
MAMALLPPDLSSLTASFTFQEFCKALGMSKGGETYKIFKAAVDECMQCIITVETEPDEQGKKAWKKFTWFTVSTFDEKTAQATMTFSDKLADFLKALKWMYSKLSLPDFGSLQSRYALKLFEMAMSYQSLKGKQGNVERHWYFERPIAELRMIMGVPPKAYKETHLFKRYVIEKPVKEINEAGIGLEITPEGVKQGRRLAAIRFDCKPAPRAVRGKRRGTEAVPLPEANPKTEQLREEKELEHLKELYPAEFAELYEAELAKAPAFMPEGFKQIGAEGSAVMQLRERHGVVK